jgi:hypothetical protein|nr:MAG TPA: hypothetical protein [Caudoviricetes sp.]
MTYIDLINAFEKWLETNYLQSSSQLLWYKLIALFNKCGWSEWITVDNHRLMSMMQMNSEKTLIRCRDKLIENKLFEYEKGTKSKPNKYKISTVNFTVNMTVDMGVHVGVDVSNINRLRQEKDIYINLFKKYKKQIEEKPNQTVQIIGQLRKSQDYVLLTEDEQNRIFLDLMNPKLRSESI